MTEKKDILEFPLEDVEVPQAIALMMQAATKSYISEGLEGVLVDDDRLQLLCEKLEARVEDAIESASSVRSEAHDEDAPNEYPEADPGDTFLAMDGTGDVYQVVHNGILFGKFCNAPVSPSAPELDKPGTYCIKQWGHDVNGLIEHEDMEGNRR